MLHREIINKMDTDDLRNYLYHLQQYVRIERDMNILLKATEDTLNCLTRQRGDLYTLSLKEKDRVHRLERLRDKMEHKYSPACADMIADIEETER